MDRSLEQLVGQSEDVSGTEQTIYDSMQLSPVEVVASEDTSLLHRVGRSMYRNLETVIDYLRVEPINASLSIGLLTISSFLYSALPPLGLLYGAVSLFGFSAQYMLYRRFKKIRQHLQAQGWDEDFIRNPRYYGNWKNPDYVKQVRLAARKEGYLDEFNALFERKGIGIKNLKQV